MSYTTYRDSARDNPQIVERLFAYDNATVKRQYDKLVGEVLNLVGSNPPARNVSVDVSKDANARVPETVS